MWRSSESFHEGSLICGKVSNFEQSNHGCEPYPYVTVVWGLSHSYSQRSLLRNSKPAWPLGPMRNGHELALRSVQC
jgi:hypothetical protein